MSEEELDLSLFDCEECDESLDECKCDVDLDEEDEDWEDS